MIKFKNRSLENVTCNIFVHLSVSSAFILQDYISNIRHLIVYFHLSNKSVNVRFHFFSTNLTKVTPAYSILKNSFCSRIEKRLYVVGNHMNMCITIYQIKVIYTHMNKYKIINYGQYPVSVFKQQII